MAIAVAIQVIGAEEKIVVAGVVSGANNDFGVLRYDSDGSLDTTFNPWWSAPAWHGGRRDHRLRRGKRPGMGGSQSSPQTTKSSR